MIVKPLPWFVDLAVAAVRDGLGIDMDRWPKRDRVRVLVAALDAELDGSAAVENAAIDVAKAVRAEHLARFRRMRQR